MVVPGDEREAVRALRRGDPRGLEPLVQRYQAAALRLAVTLTRDRQSAEDVVADAFLSAYDHIYQFDVERPFGPWLYRIVVNRALEAHRRRARWEANGGDAPLAPTPSVPTPESEALLREERQDIIAAILGLPWKQRTALVLHYYLELDERTIAQTLGCAHGTVKWLLHQARNRLREDLGRDYGPPIRPPLCEKQHETTS